jgi:hypothetical protein
LDRRRGRNLISRHGTLRPVMSYEQFENGKGVVVLFWYGQMKFDKAVGGGDNKTRGLVALSESAASDAVRYILFSTLCLDGERHKSWTERRKA